MGTPVSPPPQEDLDPRPEVLELLKTLKASLGSLNELLEESTSHWGYEDAVYRFYHQSFKVYAIQQTTDTIVEALQSLAPDRKLNSWFLQIVEEGTGVVFDPAHNPQWLTVTRPMLEAFFHARYFLEMAVLYGSKLEAPPRMMPSGWAAFLSLYGLR